MRSEKELHDAGQNAYLECHRQGDPDRTFLSHCAAARDRALYNLGRSDALAELEQAKRAEYERGFAEALKVAANECHTIADDAFMHSSDEGNARQCEETIRALLARAAPVPSEYERGVRDAASIVQQADFESHLDFGEGSKHILTTLLPVKDSGSR